MFSASHLILLFLVALLVFGPEKLPELARTFSKTVTEFRRITGEFQDTLQREMRQLERDALEHSRPKPAPPLAQPPSLPAAGSSEPSGPSTEIAELDGAAAAKGASVEWTVAPPEPALEPEFETALDPVLDPALDPVLEPSHPHAAAPEGAAEAETPVTAAAENPPNGHPSAA